MRRRWFASALVGCALVGAWPAYAQSSGGLCPLQVPNGSAALGEFGAPFEEPTVNGAAATLHCDAIGCKCSPDVDGSTLHCKPAAVSIAVTATNAPAATTSVMYYNGLEDTENIKVAQLLNFGQVAANDQSRFLTFDPFDAAASATWTSPSPVDAGANPTGNRNEYLLPPSLTNGEGKTKGAGALFCSDLVQMADGKILAAGGTSYYSEPYVAALDVGVQESEGLRNTRIYDPSDNTWTQSGDMQYGRWYPSLVTLADGRVFVASGVSKLVKPIYPNRLSDSARNVTQTETYDPATGRWAYNGSKADRSLPLFPRLHLLPNGFVYYDGAGQSFNPFGESYDQVLWNVVAAYDPSAKTWTDLGVAGLPTSFSKPGVEALAKALNAGGDPAEAAQSLLPLVDQVVSDPSQLIELVNPFALGGRLGDADLALLGAGFRGSTFSIMLPLEPNAAGDYTKAEFLTAGGVVGFGVMPSPGSYFSVPMSRVDTVEILAGGGLRHRSRTTGNLTQPRWYSTAVLLPDGSVTAFNGADRDAVDFPGIECAIQQAEKFDPSTETWAPMATSNRPRTYHGTAVLLPDGSVLVGGHATLPTLYGNDTTIPGGFPPYDGRDPSFEIYRPPYTFAPVRPVITSVGPLDVALGHLATVATPDAGNVESAVLVRNAALTHLVDGDQRSVVLPITQQSNGNVKLAITSNPAVLPAGPYLLFINRVYQPGGPRIPSKSVQVFVRH